MHDFVYHRPASHRGPGGAFAGLGGEGALQMVQVDAVARIGYRGLMRGQTLAIPGWRYRFLAFAGRLTPRRTAAGIARRLFETDRRLA